MRIAVIGAGNIGGALGKRWAAAGHAVSFGVRDPQDPKHQALTADNVQVKGLREATKATDVIVLAVPFKAVQETLEQIGRTNGKIIIDCTNAIPNPPEGFESTAEAIAAWTGSGRVIKAFNNTGFGNVKNPRYGELAIDTFICGDDAEAKAVVFQLALEAHFSVIDAGPLSAAKHLESFARFWIHLAYSQNMGVNIAFKLLQR